MVAADIGVRAERDAAGGVRIAGSTEDLDAAAVAFGREGIALRALVPGESPLRVLFAELTTADPVSPALAADATPLPAPRPDVAPIAPPASRAADVAAVMRVEVHKLARQWHARLLFVVCMVAPFVFAGGVSLAGSLPSDTLYGRWLLAAAPAMPLFALAVTGSWAFPALSSVVAGDILASEDRLGTWPTLLTRSRPAIALVVGKLLVAVACAMLAIALLAVATAGAGLALGGSGPLPGLSGQRLSDGHAYALIAACWAATLPGAVAWVTIALALSAATRSAVVGILVPALAGILLQLTLLVDGPPFVRTMFPSAALDAWHPLFEIPAATGPLIAAMLVAVAWAVTGGTALAVALSRRGSLAA